MLTDSKVWHTKWLGLFLPVLATMFFFKSCETPRDQKRSTGKKIHFNRYDLSSYRQTLEMLEKIGYTQKAFQKGMECIPRIELVRISPRWAQEASNIPIRTKKSLFLRLLAPSALMANEEVTHERERLLKFIDKIEKGSPPDRQESEWLRQLAYRYKVLKHFGDLLTIQKIKELQRRVDIVPPSLILAQAAIESAWGTSRFTIEGNSLFGQWSFSKEAMKPKRQRKELGAYRLAHFHTPLDSIRAYLLNINTHPAYRQFRRLRANLRQQHRPLKGIVLASVLDRYSERGQAYVEELRQIIRINHLEWIDQAKVTKTPSLIIQPDR